MVKGQCYGNWDGQSGGDAIKYERSKGNAMKTETVKAGVMS